VLVVQKRLAGGTAELADHASTVRNSSLRLERRQYSRDDGAGHSPVTPSPEPDGD
jgi:flagellar protein FlbD